MKIIFDVDSTLICTKIFYTKHIINGTFRTVHTSAFGPDQKRWLYVERREKSVSDVVCLTLVGSTNMNVLYTRLS